MILELADIRIHPGQNAAFEAAIAQAASTIVSQAKGFLNFTVHQGIESPERYVLHADHHQVGLDIDLRYSVHKKSSVLPGLPDNAQSFHIFM